jgi:hypothetical protein
MAKSIESLNEDLIEVLMRIQDGTGNEVVPAEALSAFSVQSALSVNRQLHKVKKVRPPNTIYASELGTNCYRKVWFKHNLSEEVKDKLSLHQPHVITKFMYGDLVEQLGILLIKAAGHTVSHEQEPVSFKASVFGVEWELRGKLDLIVDDNTIVDVKSTTTYGLKDFSLGKGGDKFGYRTQLATYKAIMELTGARPTKRGSLPSLPKFGTGFLAIDRTLGHMRYCAEPIKWGPDGPIGFLVESMETYVHAATAVSVTHIPQLAVTTEPNGNEKLCTECSYCEFKSECWKDANAGAGPRSFLYAGGKVVHLVKVVKEPKVAEIKKDIGEPDEF